MAGADAFAWMAIGVGVLALGVYLSLVVTAVVQVIWSDLGDLVKLGCVLGIVAVPVAGTIAWYLIGHRVHGFGVAPVTRW